MGSSKVQGVRTKTHARASPTAGELAYGHLHTASMHSPATGESSQLRRTDFVLDPLLAPIENAAMAMKEIDDYLASLEEPKRSTLAHLRETIMAIVPDAEQCISYGMPAFKLRGKTIAGFAAFKNHLSYLPHSGSVIPRLATETKGFPGTKGSLHFPVDSPLPKTLVKKLLIARIAEVTASTR
jgi:uncharacterized protein YdhG (YjbR/CyaY superfamily)